MEVLKHLEFYDERRWTILEGITCRDCAHNRRDGCANAIVVLDAMRSRGNDMSIPAFDFTPDPDRRADQCPGMWPSDDYLAEIGATMREPSIPDVVTVSKELADQLDKSIAAMEQVAAGEGKAAA